jgi:hypothetical protein
VNDYAKLLHLCGGALGWQQYQLVVRCVGCRLNSRQVIHPSGAAVLRCEDFATQAAQTVPAKRTLKKSGKPPFNASLPFAGSGSQREHDLRLFEVRTHMAALSNRVKAR